MNYLEDNFEFSSQANILRQALLDAKSNDFNTLTDIVSFQIESGRSVKRLVDFANRRLKVTKNQALSTILYLCPDLMC